MFCLLSSWITRIAPFQKKLILYQTQKSFQCIVSKTGFYGQDSQNGQFYGQDSLYVTQHLSIYR